MIYEKRVAGTTVWGTIFGFISWGLIVIFGAIPPTGAASIIISRGLMGFVIGISAWKISWWLHGSLIGLFFGLTSGFASVWAGYGWGGGFTLLLLTGIIFGFLTELLTTVVFKAEMREPEYKEEKRKEEKKEE